VNHRDFLRLNDFETDFSLPGAVSCAAIFVVSSAERFVSKPNPFFVVAGRIVNLIEVIEHKKVRHQQRI